MKSSRGFFLCSLTPNTSYPAVHVRPLRGLSTLSSCHPRSLPSVASASSSPTRPTTWGYSWCVPSGVSARRYCLCVQGWRGWSVAPEGNTMDVSGGALTPRMVSPWMSVLNPFHSWCDPSGSVLPTWGTEQRAWKDLGEVSRGQHDISLTPITLHLPPITYHPPPTTQHLFC